MEDMQRCLWKTYLQKELVSSLNWLKNLKYICIYKRVKVITKAGFQSNCNSPKVSLLIPVPITVPIPIPSIVLVPKGHEATSSCPLTLNRPAPNIAPKSGPAGIPVNSIRTPKDAPPRRYSSKVTKGFIDSI